MDQAVDAVRHGADVQRPVELRGKEHPKVADGLGNSNAMGCGGTQREEDGGGGNSEETGGVLRGVEEHELHFIEVHKEADLGKPSMDAVPGSRDLSCGGKEGGARGIDTAIIDIEGEVLGDPQGGKA